MKNSDEISKQFSENLGVLTIKEFEVLRDVKILLIGLGGLGGNIANGLVRLGVHHLTIVDFDCFDVTNLNRQLFSNSENLGEYKVNVIEKELLKINSNSSIVSYTSKIQDIPQIKLGDFNYIIDAVDDLKTKVFIEKLGTDLNIPVLHGACAGWYGQVGWIMPGSNLVKNIYGVHDHGIEAELKNPSFTPSAVASIMVSEFLKMIKNSENTIINQFLLIDLYNNSMLKTGKKNQ
ncbi:ThiF family adenylyltransferase [Mycoplasmatota bacterium WC30]